jgi:hypothetical protein
MRRTLTTLAVLAAVLGIMQVVPSAGAGTTAPAAATTTDIVFKEGFCQDTGAHCKVFDVGSRPNAFGTRVIFTIPLSSRGARIGYEQGECVILHKKSQLNYCTYNLNFDAGSVAVQGALPYTTQMSGTIPVTGGTGSYEGVYGHLTLIANTSDRYRLHLVTP